MFSLLFNIAGFFFCSMYTYSQGSKVLVSKNKKLYLAIIISKKLFPCFTLLLAGGVTFHSLLVTRWNSLVARYSLQNSLVTRCRSCSLQKLTRYSLQNSLATRCRSCSLQKFVRCKKSLVALCKIWPLLIA